MGAETQRSPGANRAAAVICSLAKTSDIENSTPAQIRKTRCPGCARLCTRLVPVRGWHDRRETLLCKRCASGLILDRGRIRALKLRPENSRVEAQP
jgi:hypothetical protein